MPFTIGGLEASTDIYALTGIFKIPAWTLLMLDDVFFILLWNCTHWSILFWWRRILDGTLHMLRFVPFCLVMMNSWHISPLHVHFTFHMFVNPCLWHNSHFTNSYQNYRRIVLYKNKRCIAFKTCLKTKFVAKFLLTDYILDT